MGAGVHSGWSIVDYRYKKVIQVNVASGVIRAPSHRLIFEHYEYQDFNAFLL